MKTLTLIFGILLTLFSSPAYTQAWVLPTFDDRIVQVLADCPNGTISYGAGFFVTPRGTFLTAAHIVSNYETKVEYKNFRARMVIGDSLKIFPVTLVHNFLIDTPACDLALFQVTSPLYGTTSFPFFHISTLPPAGTQVIIAGYPTIFETVPTHPIYRYGMVAAPWRDRGTLTAILDLPPVKGFSGAPVVNIAVDPPSVFGVIQGFAAGPEADFSSAHVLPIEAIQKQLKRFNDAKRAYFDPEG